MCACGSISSEKPGERHHFDDAQPRDEAVLTVDRGDQAGVVVVALQALEEGEIILQEYFSSRIQYIDRPCAFGLMALADLEVVEVMRGRDLDRPGALFGIGIIVGDDRHQAADQRQPNPPADQMAVALIVGMDGHRGVAEHRLGPRGGDHHPLAGFLAVRVHHRIFEIIEMAVWIPGQDLGQRRRVERRLVVARPFEGALALDLDDLEVGDRGLELRVPVDQALVLVDEPLAMELDENPGDRARQACVQREALAAPVAGGAEPLELLDDRPARFGLPRPDPLEERLAAHGPPIRLLRLDELSLDDHLGRDAGVVGSRLPQHVLAVHPPIAAENVLQRVVERVAHMQIAGHVRRRNDHAERLGVLAFGSARPESAGLLPEGGDPGFDRGGVKRFVHH